MVPQILPQLNDEKDVVRYTAAGAIIHLSQLKAAAPALKPVTPKNKKK